MERRYVTADVFTDRMFGGNPLAVVLDAEGLSAPQMQAIAAEFNYAETTFVLPPSDPVHTAHVRIFTPRSELPFAGHPNVGTAVILAHDLSAKRGHHVDEFVFEERAGLVLIRLLRDGAHVVGAELRAPEPLSIRAAVSVNDAAACLSLPPSDVRSAAHPPQVVSVGLPFLVTELVSREALRRARPSVVDHERVLPPIGTDAIFAYVRGGTAHELHARMFAPLDGIVEDPATGSAAAATIALLAALQPEATAGLAWRIEQGVDMGRASLLLGKTEKLGGTVGVVRVGGQVIPVMRGVLNVVSAVGRST